MLSKIVLFVSIFIRWFTSFLNKTFSMITDFSPWRRTNMTRCQLNVSLLSVIALLKPFICCYFCRNDQLVNHFNLELIKPKTLHQWPCKFGHKCKINHWWPNNSLDNLSFFKIVCKLLVKWIQSTNRSDWVKDCN